MIAPGNRLGPYEILAPLGAGGMGEIFHARDTRLDRGVAVKVLPADFVADAVARERFEREARSIAALNHPHICTLYDVGRQGDSDYLVMELLEGETLARRIERGPVPLAAALRIATDIADALDAAHRHGIVHRDLKPANVMLTKTGAKLLDFGLARGVNAATVGPAATMAPLTGAGTILGTLHYMAPEQVEGRDTDHRTDIFAFGVLVHEMVTGRKAFDGRSQASVIAAILNSEPVPLTSAQPLAPAALDHIIRRCLAKDPDDRWQSARDLANELRHLADAHQSSTATQVVHPTRRPRVAALAAGIIGLAIGASAALTLAWLWSPAQTAAMPSLRMAITLPGVVHINSSRPSLAISPDGRRVAFVAVVNGTRQLFYRGLNTFDAVALRGTENATGPFFSPDGEWLGFHQGGRLMKIPVTGSAPIPICDAPDVRGAVWTEDDTIVFSPRLNAGLFRVSASGGTPVALTTPNAEGRERTHRFPDAIPNGRGIVFTIGTHDIASFADASIAVVPAAGGTPKIIIPGGTMPKYLPTGHVLYARDGVLFTVPFDADRLEVTGPPAPVTQGVAHAMDFGWADFSVSRTGTLIYLPGDSVSVQNRLVWVDRTGTVTPMLSTPRMFMTMSFSPDGQKVLAIVGGANDSAWLYDIRRDTLSRLTSRGHTAVASWSPDGRRVLYSTDVELASIAADGSGDERVLYRDDHRKTTVRAVPGTDQVLFQTDRPGTGADIWQLSLKTGQVEPWLSTRFLETSPRVSPDGRWVAFASNDSGRFEVYVRPFRGGGGRWQVSRAGGLSPVWSADGKELFFIEDRTVMSAPVTGGDTFDAGVPQKVFQLRTRGMLSADAFDVSPDGKRFVTVEAVDSPSISHANVVVGWFAELARK